MEEESKKLKEILKKYSLEILYDQNGYIITTNRRDPTTHHLIVNDSYLLLNRGILEELSKMSEINIKDRLNCLSPSIYQEVTKNESSLGELVLALKEAIRKEQKILEDRKSVV